MDTSLPSLHVVKGHGTRNDFVLVPDADSTMVGPLQPDLVRALADRRAGVGSDGVIRVVRSAAALQDGSLDPAVTETEAEGHSLPEWFMDYWNADGTTSEMCGNGVRVFVRYLLQEGLAVAPFELMTRGGTKTAEVTSSGDIKVGMGRYRLSAIEPEFVTARGLDADDSGIGAVSVDMGNPHTVALVAAAQDLADLDLTQQPQVLPTPVAGTNIEFIKISRVSAGHGELDMRVHERGVGETEACGTGACASAIAAHLSLGEQSPKTWTVRMPGGPVTISFADDGYTYLAGPAEIVASVHLNAAWLSARGLSLGG